MEPQIPNNVEVKASNPLFQVTPHSKYFALLLFIILPFIGAWIGYEYALNTKVNVVSYVQLDNPVTNVKRDLITDNQYEISESDVDDSLAKYTDLHYGVAFTYPKAEIDVLPLSQSNGGSLLEISKVVDGVKEYSKVTTLATPPNEIPATRSYDFKLYSLDEYIFKVVSGGYEYRYDPKTESIACISRIDSPDGYNPCSELLNEKVGKTEAGNDIYLFGSGDGGYATKSYVVVLPNKNAIISFSTSKTEYYEGWLSGPELDKQIQVVLKSVK